MPKKLRTRTVTWTPEHNTVTCPRLGTIEVGVTDPDEPGRPTTLRLTTDDSPYLVGRLAQLTGLKVRDEADTVYDYAVFYKFRGDVHTMGVPTDSRDHAIEEADKLRTGCPHFDRVWVQRRPARWEPVSG